MKAAYRTHNIAALGAMILTLCVSGCTSPSKVMQSWVGSHQSDLIASWGPPNRTASDGKGGTILIYEQYVNLGQTPGHATTDYFGNITYTAPQQQGYQRSRMLWVDENGVIYRWKWKGF